MSRRKGNLAISIIANMISVIVSAFVSFIITKYVVETVGSTTYSFYPIATNFANYFSIIFISVNAMSARFITVAFVNHQEEDAKKYFTSVLFADLGIAVVLSLLLIVFIARIEYILNIPVAILPSIRKLFIYLLIMVIVNGVCSVYIIAPYARNRMDIAGVISIIDNITKLLFFLFLLNRGDFHIEHYGLVLLVAAIVNLVLNYFATKVLLPGFSLDLKLLSLEHIKEVVSSGFWIMINRSGVLLINNAQLLVINIVLGADASGPLSLTQPIYSFISLFGSAMVNTITPLVVRTVAQKKETFDQDVRYIQLLFALLIGGLCTIVMGFGEQFYHLYLPKEDAHLLYVLSYLNLLQLLITYITTFYTAFLTAINKVKVPSLVMLGIGVIGIGIMFLILKSTNLGIIGMLIANNLTYFFYYFIFQTLYARKECEMIQEDWKKSLKIMPLILSGLFFIVLNTLLGRIIPISNFVSLILICGVILIIEIFGLLFINRVKIGDFISFIRK